jgi:hypothetical protein
MRFINLNGESFLYEPGTRIIDSEGSCFDEVTMGQIEKYVVEDRERFSVCFSTCYARSCQKLRRDMRAG